MSILFAGDTHGNMRHMAYLFETAKRNGCDTIFQVGDFGYWPHTDWGRLFLVSVDAHIRETGVQVYFIDGNHENHDALDALPVSDDGLRYLTVDGGLVHVPRGAWVTIDGVHILGYGGAYSIDADRRIPGQSWWWQETIDWEHCLTTAAEYMGASPHILATHDAPSGFEMRNVYKSSYRQTNANRSCLRTLTDHVNPGRVICGHWHERVIARVDGFQVDVLDCDQARDRRDSWLIVEGGDRHGADTNPPEGQVPQAARSEDSGVEGTDQPVTPEACVAVG